MTVCQTALRDAGAWAAARDAEPALAPHSTRQLAALAAVGVIGARQLPTFDGGLDLDEAAYVMETLGAEMASADLAGALAAGPLVAAIDPTLAERLAAGSATAAVGVASDRELRACATAAAKVVVVHRGTAVIVDMSSLAWSINDVDPSRPVLCCPLAAAGEDGRSVAPELARSTALGYAVLVAAEAVGSARAACTHTTEY